MDTTTILLEYIATYISGEMIIEENEQSNKQSNDKSNEQSFFSLFNKFLYWNKDDKDYKVETETIRLK
jgi:hypothetical protein